MLTRLGLWVNNMIVLASSSELYDDIKEKQNKAYEDIIKKLESGEDINIDLSSLDGFSKMLWSKFFELYVTVKNIFPLGFSMSIVIGILLLLVFKKNKVIRKSAITIFIIGIPLVLLIIVYLIPGLAPVFIRKVNGN